MAFSVARTRDEAHLFLDLNPCEDCGSVDTAWESTLAEFGGEPAAGYAGVCEGCGARREFLFGVPERDTAPITFPSFGGPEPSQLLDAGEWLWVADLTAGDVPEDDPAAARRALAIAMAAVEEVVKFIPPGESEVPEHAFWSERGFVLRATDPGRFQLDRLLVIRDTYRDLLAAR
ncbi:hypothetical protein [Sphaerisporangium sp. NPDC051011]|uniref:hypothetical protein n=1 Tax=Sphaerisporangium sp. NPDC051011 TaxID=3155792 RepID=UPI0033C40FA3